MASVETFEAIAHPLRIKILKLLAERPMSFSELKRSLELTFYTLLGYSHEDERGKDNSGSNNGNSLVHLISTLFNELGNPMFDFTIFK